MSLRPLRLVLAICAVSVSGLVFSTARVLAAEGESPVISQVGTAEVAEHEVEVEAQIDPEGRETVYEVDLVGQSRPGESTGGWTEPVTALGGGIVEHLGGAGFEDVTATATFTKLLPGYVYFYRIYAANKGGGETNGEPIYSFGFGCADPYPTGDSPNIPFGSRVPLWYTFLSEEESAKTRREYEAKHAKELEAQHALEHEQQVSREAAAKVAEGLAVKEREERERDHGGLSLAGTSIMVQKNGAALVKLNCLGSASCRGRLTLTAKGTVNAKASKKARKTEKASTVTIGTVGFSTAGDETKAVTIELDAAGRALLGVDHGRLSAGVTILQFEPGPAQTQAVNVRLVQQKVHGGRGTKK